MAGAARKARREVDGVPALEPAQPGGSYGGTIGAGQRRLGPPTPARLGRAAATANRAAAEDERGSADVPAGDDDGPAPDPSVPSAGEGEDL